MDIGWEFAIVLVATSFLTGLAVLMTVSYLPLLPRRAASGAVSDKEEIAFLFDDDRLVDATHKARSFLAQGPEGMSEWSRLTALLAPHFPDFVKKVSALSDVGFVELHEEHGGATLRARWIGGTARITLHQFETDSDSAMIDQSSLVAMQAEMSILRGVAARMPTLSWQQDAKGAIVWANKAYLDVAESVLGDGEMLIWPLPRLFGTLNADVTSRRHSITLAGEEMQWFDCTGFAHGDSTLFFATPADAAVSAENSLQNFVQTLTKTFAGLPTGLAIFNRSRDLVMFNPALVDLCMLEPQFLTSRPSLFVFLDRLREKQMIPEPKDYKSWRQKMTTLEQDAVNGVYEEIWSLPSGQTYRVTGRPHPDGAVAFLIEDISSEVSLTRHFRAELETGQAVIDSFDEAMAVFSPAGVLTMSNAAYADLWGSDPAMTLSEVTLRDSVELWQTLCEEPSALGEVSDLMTHAKTDPAFQEQVSLKDGRILRCRVKPICGGASLIGFKEISVLPDAGRVVASSQKAMTA